MLTSFSFSRIRLPKRNSISVSTASFNSAKKKGCETLFYNTLDSNFNMRKFVKFENDLAHNILKFPCGLTKVLHPIVNGIKKDISDLRARLLNGSFSTEDQIVVQRISEGLSRHGYLGGPTSNEIDIKPHSSTWFLDWALNKLNQSYRSPSLEVLLSTFEIISEYSSSVSLTFKDSCMYKKIEDTNEILVKYRYFKPKNDHGFFQKYSFKPELDSVQEKTTSFGILSKGDVGDSEHPQLAEHIKASRGFWRPGLDPGSRPLRRSSFPFISGPSGHAITYMGAFDVFYPKCENRLQAKLEFMLLSSAVMIASGSHSLFEVVPVFCTDPDMSRYLNLPSYMNCENLSYYNVLKPFSKEPFYKELMKHHSEILSSKANRI